MRSYEAKDGGKRWVTEVIAEQVRFLDKRGTDTNVGSKTEMGHEVEFNEDDIPF